MVVTNDFSEAVNFSVNHLVVLAKRIHLSNGPYFSYSSHYNSKSKSTKIERKRVEGCEEGLCVNKLADSWFGAVYCLADGISNGY